MSLATSAAARRLDRNAAIIAAHPRWHGIRHPELIPFPPPKRYSRLDMLPAIGRNRPGARAAWDVPRSRAERIAHNRELLAAHPRWRGILHPERLVFAEHLWEPDPVVAYHDAVRRALRSLHESEQLCSRVRAVADAIDRRSWPWAASPAELEPRRPPPPSNSNRLRRLPASIRLPERRVRRHVGPTSRPIPH